MKLRNSLREVLLSDFNQSWNFIFTDGGKTPRCKI